MMSPPVAGAYVVRNWAHAVPAGAYVVALLPRILLARFSKKTKADDARILYRSDKMPKKDK